MSDQRYNTGNPIGSDSPLDRSDNTRNLDVAVNAEQDTFQDRLGKNRLTWAGMENQFDADQSSREAVFSDFLQASGYQDLGEYAPGIEITAHNQYVTFDGQPYLLKPSIPVPYTTSGEWTGDDFKLIGDDALRQDLANPDMGAAVVAFKGALPGASPRILSDKAQEVISIDDFDSYSSGDDYSPAINKAIEEVYAVGGKLVGTPGKIYGVASPIKIQPSNDLRDVGFVLSGWGSKIVALPGFDAAGNKAVIESLSRKNGVNLVASRSNCIIEGFNIDARDSGVAAVAISGLVRGSSVRGLSTRGGHHGIMASGCWSMEIYGNNVWQPEVTGILLGSEIDVNVDPDTDLISDNGIVTTGIVNEGYEHLPGQVSAICNAMRVVGNTTRGGLRGIQNHFGNALLFSGNTSELNRLNLVITAMESGEVSGANYFEGGYGAIWLGRDTGGIVEDSVIEGNFFHGQKIIQRGLIRSRFTRNRLHAGTARTSIGSFQRNFGNTSQIPNTVHKADTSDFKPSYTFGRDGAFSLASEDRVTHSGTLSTVIDESFLNSPFKRTRTGDGELLELVESGAGQRIGQRNMQTVSDIEEVVATSSRGLCIVTGVNASNTTVSFVDVVLYIAFDSAIVIGSKDRGNPATRAYSVSGQNLLLSMDSGEWRVRTTVIGD